MSFVGCNIWLFGQDEFHLSDADHLLAFKILAGSLFLNLLCLLGDYFLKPG